MLLLILLYWLLATVLLRKKLRRYLPVAVAALLYLVIATLRSYLLLENIYTLQGLLKALDFSALALLCWFSVMLFARRDSNGQ